VLIAGTGRSGRRAGERSVFDRPGRTLEAADELSREERVFVSRLKTAHAIEAPERISRMHSQTTSPVPAPARPRRLVSSASASAASAPALSRASSPDWAALQPQGSYARWGQPLFNRVLLALVLPVAVPLGCAIALVNWVAFRDVRRIFFVQPRMGWRRTPFSLIKFRTMREVSGGNFEAWTNGEQARVTRLGRLLRNTHLDELPQVLNVLRGEMNFIGPRPEMLEIEAWATEHIPEFSSRLAIKPGLTGWAQITQGYTGRDIPAYVHKLALNRRYLEEFSLLTDLEILARTALWMLRGRGWSWNASARR
jgi:lipopolysaccharide/colanic/teichoic acid biosynthesis glycosyltransferase